MWEQREEGSVAVSGDVTTDGDGDETNSSIGMGGVCVCVIYID